MRKQFMTFDDLGLAEPVLRALGEEGYTTPTPIQAQAIKPVLTGADLLGIAQTGTGKTAAFALPILTRLAADRRPALRRGCRVLVLSPTRELATQIAESFRAYGRHLGTTVTVVFGGVAHRPQIQALARGVDVLVATPGRLLDHMAERHVDLSGTEILVLDEADQMLDLGFVKPIRRIVAQLSGRRQNLFFSATMPHEIAALAGEMLRDPIRVAVAPVGTTVERVSQRVIHVEAARKRQLLVELFRDDQMSRTLVFTRTKRGADRVAAHLSDAGIAADAIHGNKSQRQRENALDAFKKAEVRVLVATDIAARGIDIDAVTHVVNFELPEVPEAYVHRIGRTARAGAEGSAISLCDGEERDLLRAIEKLTRQQIPAEDRRIGGATLAELSDEPRAQRGRRQQSGGRSSGEGRGRSEGRSRPEGRPERSRSHAAGERSGFRSGDQRRDRADDRPRSAGPARAESRSRDGGPSRFEGRPRSEDQARSDRGSRDGGQNRFEGRPRSEDRGGRDNGQARPERRSWSEGQSRPQSHGRDGDRARSEGNGRPDGHSRSEGQARGQSRPEHRRGPSDGAPRNGTGRSAPRGDRPFRSESRDRH